MVSLFVVVRPSADEDDPHQEGRYALLSLPIHMLISSRNTLTGIPGIVFDQISGHPMAPSS